MENIFVTFLASFLIWMMVGGLFVLWFIDGRIKREQVLHCILAIGLAVVADSILKSYFHIPRPFMINGHTSLTLFKGTDWSFPSEHATIAAALATTVWIHDKRLGSVYIVAAFLVGVGRVLSNVHYPIDIFGGAVVGILIALLLDKTHLFKLTPK